MTLKSTIEHLASQFAASIFAALKSASIQEVMEISGGRVPAAAAASAPAAAAPVKRGPGRPKKVAAAAPAPAAKAAPKAAAKSAPAPKAAAAPAKRGPGRPKGSGSKTSSGRLARRSEGDIGQLVESIVSLLHSHPDGLRAEQIRGALGIEAKELPRPLSDALNAGSISKSGQKRATTYFAAGGGKGKKRK